jgi:integrase
MDDTKRTKKEPAARVKNLTKRAIDAARPEAARFIIWDSALKGFGLRVEPTGSGQGRKTFLIRYRAGGGRTGTLRQANIGRYGTITVEQARQKAKAMLGAAGAGGDPLGERLAKRRAGITVAEVCDWYLEQADAGRLLGRKGRPLKASTVAMDRSRIETHVRPRIGRKAVANLTPADIEDFQADIAARKKLPPTKRPGAAGRSVSGGAGVAPRVIAMLSAIFSHAKRKGLVAVNPALGVRKIAPGRREIRLSIDQVQALGAAMHAASNREYRSGLAAIRFMLLTGFRSTEAKKARYDDFLSGGGGLALPDSKTGPQLRPVGKAALDPFARGGSGWLFPSDKGDRPFSNTAKMLARLCKAAGLPPISPHILRHSFASIAADLGYSELTIAGLLGHAAGSVTAGYVHLDISLVAAADRVSGVIARALDDKQEVAVDHLPIEDAATSATRSPLATA